jgi:hypothetical protein
MKSLEDGKYFTGVSSKITITLTDANDKPLPGATITETNKKVTGGTVGIVENKSTVVTTSKGTLQDFVAVGKNTDGPDFGKEGETVEDFKEAINNTEINSTTEQTLTVTTADRKSFQVTYQRTVTNVGSDGKLNEKTNANGVNVSVTATTPVIKPLP